MKKILFIIWSYTFGGGAESLLTSIVNNLNPDKYDISIIEYYHVGIKEEPVNENIHILAPICTDGKFKNRIKRFLVCHCPQLILHKYIKEEYDLYIAFNYMIPSFLLPKGGRNIQWIHGNVYDLLDEKLKRQRKRQDKAFDKADKIVVISDLTEKSVNDLFPRHREKLIKLYNGVDVDLIRKKSYEDTNIKLERPSIIFLGRLEDAKDPLRLIYVLQLVHKKGVAVHLYFLGEGELKHSIIEKAHQYCLSGFVHVLGYQQNPFPIMRQCNAICVLSKTEGFGMCWIEGLVLGKPFVATPTGIAEKIMNPRCGYVIETNEEAAIAIITLINEDTNKLAKECQDSIKCFGLKSYIDQIEELIDNVSSTALRN